MIWRVVDTNVAVVANGRHTHASPDCRLAAIDFLNGLVNRGKIILDLAGDMQEEYRRHLNPSGQPGVGDRFFQVVLNSAPRRVVRVDLPKEPSTGAYRDFPSDPALARFDPSDRKFAAAARRTGQPVANATDSDWLDYKAALNANGIAVDFVCGCDRQLWGTDGS
jgi:hypothetical protein